MEWGTKPHCWLLCPHTFHRALILLMVRTTFQALKENTHLPWSVLWLFCCLRKFNNIMWSSSSLGVAFFLGWDLKVEVTPWFFKCESSMCILFFFSRNRKVLVNCSLHRITFSIVIFTNTETTLDERKVKEALENAQQLLSRLENKR